MPVNTLRPLRAHQLRESARSDPYRSQSKPGGRVLCPVCGAISLKGRWVPATRKSIRSLPDGELKRTACPACLQKKQRFAQGVVELRGESWKENRDQVERTISNSEKIARSRNDQERVLWTGGSRGIMKVYVSLPELARRIGRELEKSFHGEAEYVHSTEEPYLRVRWWSDGVPEKAESHRSRAFRGRGRS